MFTGACGPPEKLSLALAQRYKFLRMIVRLACRLSSSTDCKWRADRWSSHFSHFPVAGFFSEVVHNWVVAEDAW